jgi:hypothetical protein
VQDNEEQGGKNELDHGLLLVIKKILTHEPDIGLLLIWANSSKRQKTFIDFISDR